MPSAVKVSGVFDAAVQKQLEGEREILSDEGDEEILSKEKGYPLKVDEVQVLEEQGMTRRQLGITESDFEAEGETGFAESATIIVEEDEKNSPCRSALKLDHQTDLSMDPSKADPWVPQETRQSPPSNPSPTLSKAGQCHRSDSSHYIR